MKVTVPVFTALGTNSTNKPPQPQNAAFEHRIETDASSRVKKGVFVTTLLGTMTALAMIMKSKGYSLNPKNIMKTAPKNWGLWNVKYEGWQILGLAAGSVGGGLVGGALIDDKKHIKAKLRESVIQMVGNITIPIIAVTGAVEGYKLLKGKLKITNKILDGSMKVLSSLVGLGVGIVVGNKTGNTINEKIFHVKDNRHVKPADFSAHIDDMCLAISLLSAANKSTVAGDVANAVEAAPSGLGHIISRIIPAALMVAGFSTGTMQEKQIPSK